MELTILTACAIGIIVLAIGIFGVWQRQGLILEKLSRQQTTLFRLAQTLDEMSGEQVNIGSSIFKELAALKFPFADPKDGDELYENARALVIEMQQASSSLLQRVLGIGYSRAAALIDRLEQNDVIGPARGSDPREVMEKEIAE